MQQDSLMTQHSAALKHSQDQNLPQSAPARNPTQELCQNSDECGQFECCLGHSPNKWCVDIRSSPLLLKHKTSTISDCDAKIAQLSNTYVRDTKSKPHSTTIYTVNIPLLQREMWISDQITSSDPTDIIVNTLHLPNSYSTAYKSDLNVGDRYSSATLIYGTGIGMYGYRPIGIPAFDAQLKNGGPGSSSKGRFIKEILETFVSTAKIRLVLFTHLDGPCGYEGLQTLLENCGVHNVDKEPKPHVRPPWKLYGAISQDTQDLLTITEMFERGECSTLLVNGLSEGISLNNVQLMILTEPTSDPATWIQEIARVSRLGSYANTPYYTRKPHVCT